VWDSPQQLRKTRQTKPKIKFVFASVRAGLRVAAPAVSGGCFESVTSLKINFFLASVRAGLRAAAPAVSGAAARFASRPERPAG